MSERVHHFMTKWDGNIKFVILMFTAIVLSVLFTGQQERQNVIFDQQVASQVKIAKNTAALQKALTTQCNDRNIAAANTNGIISSLMKSPVLDVLSATDRAERLQLYISAKVPIIDCTIEAVPSQYKISERPASMMAPKLVVMVTS